jgi:phosphoglycolate phosphatase-like HAD superfamily hydrolase
MKNTPERIALFDLDGTLCDYDDALLTEMEKLRSPNERKLLTSIHDDAPPYMKYRADLIRRSEDWWVNIPKLKIGWDILKLVRSMGFRIMILTAGPKSNPNAWSGKKKWIDRHLGSNTDITITRDKGLVYGTILVDDYPKYAERWLQWRKNGLVVMPYGSLNRGYSHPQVVRYHGRNLDSVREAIQTRLAK